MSQIHHLFNGMATQKKKETDAVKRARPSQGRHGGTRKSATTFSEAGRIPGVNMKRRKK